MPEICGKFADTWAVSTPSTTSGRSPGVTTTAPSNSRSSTLGRVIAATTRPVASRASSDSSPLTSVPSQASHQVAPPRGAEQRLLGQGEGGYALAAQRRRFGINGCTDCASMARAASKAPGVDAVGAVAELLAAPELGAELPPSAPIDYPQRRLFAEVGLVRDRRGRAITTVYGGSDVPVTGRLESGLACNPTFLRWQWGGVRLHSVRLSRAFFGLGPFRSEGLEIRAQTARLSEHITAGTISRCPSSVAALTGVTN